MPDKLSETLASGKTVGGGRYILNRPVGEHSNTWLAQDDVENKPVVLNFLPPELCQDPRALEELRNTINSVRDFSHPNIGNVYELYEAEGEETFISAEYIEGINLRGLQQMQPNRVFSWTFLAPLLKQIFAAMQYVHENNIAQGSIKPSALMLDRKNQIKLLDVGVAGILNNPLFAGPPQMGVGGLLPYLSPQQIDGNLPAATDDIYSLGVTIYELLTGTVPFYQGDILPQIRSAQPETIEQRLAKLRISNPIPPIFSSMVMECLSKDPAARPQNIETLSKSLEIAETMPVETPTRQMPVQKVDTRGALEVLPAERGLAEAKPVQQAKKPVMAIAIAAAVAVIAIGGGVFFFLKKQPSGDTAQNTPAEPGVPKMDAKEKELLDAENKLHKEVTDVKNGNPSPPVPTPAPEGETAEEKRLRRLAEDAKELKTLSEKSGSGQLSLFNGKDLQGWSGDPNYWSVRDGCITAQTPDNAVPNVNTCLTWTGGDVQDFELHFQFKAKMIKGSTLPYGGVVYRGHPGRDWDVNGYECRLAVTGDNMGMMTSRERMGIISFTQKSVVRDFGGMDKVYVQEDLDPPAEILKVLKRDDWNECVVIARGNHFIHKINGKTVADLTDENDKKRYTKGLLAFELNTASKPAAFIQYKDIKLKKLGAGGGGTTNANDRAETK